MAGARGLWIVTGRPGMPKRRGKAKMRDGEACVMAAEMLERLAEGDRRALARAITLVESTRRRPSRRGPRAPRRAAAARAPGLRVGLTGTPGVGKSSFIESLGPHADRPRPAARRAGGRSLLGALGRLDPRRQDPHGASRPLAARLHPPEPQPGGARRRRPPLARGDPARRGLGRRGGAGRDRRRRPVRDHGRRDDRRLRPPHRPRRRRRAAGGEARHHGDGRPPPRQQGRRRARARGAAHLRRLRRRAPPAPPAPRRPAGLSPRHDRLGADRRRAARGLGRGRGAGRGAASPAAPGRRGGAPRPRPGSPTRWRPGWPRG